MSASARPVVSSRYRVCDTWLWPGSGVARLWIGIVYKPAYSAIKNKARPVKGVSCALYVVSTWVCSANPRRKIRRKWSVYRYQCSYWQNNDRWIILRLLAWWQCVLNVKINAANSYQ